MDEIAFAVIVATNNGLCDDERQLLINHYNDYYMAVQLMQSHLDIPYKFTKFIPFRNGKLTNRYMDIEFSLMKRKR